MPNAVAMLKADHAKFRTLFARLENGGSESKQILSELEKELKIHSILEEELFYPTFREAANNDEQKDMYFEALEEHHVLDMILPEMKPLSADSDHFKAKATVLKELVEHHAGEEEEEMFPQAQEMLGEARMLRLGASMAERRQELEGQWESVLAGTFRKLQSAADKFMPTSVKEARGAKGEALERDEKR